MFFPLSSREWWYVQPLKSLISETLLLRGSEILRAILDCNPGNLKLKATAPMPTFQLLDC